VKTECPELTKLDNGKISTLAGKVVEVSGEYYQCRAKHKALIDMIFEVQQ